MQMNPLNTDDAPLNEIWARVFDRVRRDINVATVWLAMQAIKPLAIDGHYFVAALPTDMKFLGINLQSGEVSLAIEDALQKEMGRVLAFKLIEGETLADWEVEKVSAATPPRAAPSAEVPPAARAAESMSAEHYAPPSDREVFQTWEALNEELVHGIKSARLMKYPQGQAAYILSSIEKISDTMDLLFPAAGQPRDEAQERTLAKTIDRLGSVVNLDPLFIALDLGRYRRSIGKDIF